MRDAALVISLVLNVYTLYRLLILWGISSAALRTLKQIYPLFPDMLTAEIRRAKLLKDLFP